jgi:hypothetical protein
MGETRVDLQHLLEDLRDAYTGALEETILTEVVANALDSGATHVATRWHLASRRRAPWKWIQPPGMTESRGTAVQLILANQLSPLLDAGYLEETVRRHFEPLLDPMFDDLLRRYYRYGVVFEVDGRELSRTGVHGSEIVATSITLGRRRTPSATGFIERSPLLPADRAGIAISTFGKVIKRGWDWLGLTPAPRAHIGGLIEAPDLAACLTLSKNDFIRTGTRGASYLAYRKAIQEVVSAQLAQWGDASDAEARPRTLRLERDLERVLEDLADEFPLLRSLVDRRAGGQKRLPMRGRGNARVPAPLFAQLPPGAESPPGGSEELSPDKLDSPPGSMDERAPSEDQPNSDHRSDLAAASAGSDTIHGRRRPARYGLLLQFESRPADAELGRLVDSTIFINDAHPAFTRAVASRSVGYHTALAVALALVTSHGRASRRAHLHYALPGTLGRRTKCEPTGRRSATRKQKKG